MASALELAKGVEEFHAAFHDGPFADCQNGLCELARKMGEAIAAGNSGWEPTVAYRHVEMVLLNHARAYVLGLVDVDVQGLGALLRMGTTLMALACQRSYREVAEQTFAQGPDDDEWRGTVAPRLLQDAERFREDFEEALRGGSGRYDPAE